LRAHPLETKQLIVAALSKGGDRGPRDPGSMLAILPESKAEIIRAVVATYTPGDLRTPFLGYFAYFGEERDMHWLMDFISSNPDDVRAVEMAKVMIEGKNPYALAALRSLKTQSEGEWQESREAKQFFAQPAASSASLTPAEAVKPPAQTASKTSVDGDVNMIAPSSGRWRWAVGGALVAALLLLFLQKKRS
jgi:hypothetical protein